MKPSELPFYDDSKSDGEPFFTRRERNFISLLNGVSKVRIYLQDHSKPLEMVWSSAIHNATKVTETAKAAYLQQKSIVYNSFVFGSCVAGGVLVQSLFPKSWYFRRFLTPVLFGTAAATYLHQETALETLRTLRGAGVKKFEEFRKK